MPLLILPLLLVSLYYAWRYSKIEIDPDWALFNMANFTGSLYGRDFCDVKTPAIHFYYWVIGKIVGKSVPKVLFTHHFIMGAMSIPFYLITGDFWASLALVVLINSGWILAMHGNVGQQPAILMLFALIVPNPWAGAALFILAVLFEPKMVLSFIAVMVIKQWYIPTAVISTVLIVVMLLFRYFRKDWWDWIWESSVSLPKQLQAARQGGAYLHKWMPWFTASGLIYVLPWLGLSVTAKPDYLYWLPAVLYILFIAYGRVIRPNHLIPLIPWIVLSGITPMHLAILMLADFLSSGMYLGDIWMRFYNGLYAANIEAKELGEWLKNKAGSLYVNHYHTGIYIWAQKPVNYYMTEQAEIREFTDRRAEMLKRWKENPADWVIFSPKAGINFNGAGYKLVARNDTGTALFQKVKR